MKIKAKKTRGIYYLYKDGIVVYIGQSLLCEKRVMNHLGNIDFDEYEIIEIKNGELNEIEADEILKYKPKYNKSIPKNKKFISLKSFIEEKTGKSPFGVERRLAKIFSEGIKPIILDKRLYFKRNDLEKMKIK